MRTDGVGALVGHSREAVNLLYGRESAGEGGQLRAESPELLEVQRRQLFDAPGAGTGES